MKKQNKGFTLVELLIVIVIIGILAAIIVPSVSSAIEKANLANDQSDVKNMNTIIALEAIERNADYLEALEVQNILKEQGYDLVPQASGYSFWYNTSKNAIELHKTDDMMNKIATASYVNNNVYAAEKGNKDENALEAVIPGQPHMFYIDEGDRALTKVINGIRDLVDDNVAVGDSLSKGTQAIKNAFNGLVSNSDEMVQKLSTHFQFYNPDVTLYITEKGFFGGSVTENETDKIARDILKVYIPADVKTIPEPDVNAVLVAEAVISIPRSVNNIDSDAFQSMTGANITFVVTTDVMNTVILPAGSTVKKSANVSTMKILEIVYTWTKEDGTAGTPVDVLFGKKNYLPYSWDATKGKAIASGKFQVKADLIKDLVNEDTEIALSNTFDKETGFTYLKAYIRNKKDGTLVAGTVVRYMFVNPTND